MSGANEPGSKERATRYVKFESAFLRRILREGAKTIKRDCHKNNQETANGRHDSNAAPLIHTRTQHR